MPWRQAALKLGAVKKVLIPVGMGTITVPIAWNINKRHPNPHYFNNQSQDFDAKEANQSISTNISVLNYTMLYYPKRNARPLLDIPVIKWSVILLCCTSPIIMICAMSSGPYIMHRVTQITQYTWEYKGRFASGGMGLWAIKHIRFE